jgi:hypothetical protein
MIRVTIDCGDCKGRGFFERAPVEECPACDGRGVVRICISCLALIDWDVSDHKCLELDPPAPPRADSPPDPRPRETITDVFTFGFDCAHPATGAPLKGMYVEITAQDHEAARDGMIARFGLRWAFQYPSREAAGVWRHGLRLLEEITV